MRRLLDSLAAVGAKFVRTRTIWRPAGGRRMGDYLRPTRLEEALAALAEKPRTVLAGGTDFYPARVGRPLADDVVDITGLAALSGIRREAGHWRIGCLASWSELIATALPPAFDGLKEAAREVGGVQIQN